MLATRGNLNNDIGLPLTLLALRARARYAVDRAGHEPRGRDRAISRSSRAPTIALVNNAQREHQRVHAARVEAIARARRRRSSTALPADGIAVINADDALRADCGATARGEPARVVEFGLDAARRRHARRTRCTALDSELVLQTPAGERDVDAARARRAQRAQRARRRRRRARARRRASTPSRAGSTAFRPVTGRLQVEAPAAAARRVIDDTYNANPDSVRAAIDVLARRAGRRVLVLGDMGELGDAGAPAFHREVGEYARDARASTALLALGELRGARGRRRSAPARAHYDDDRRRWSRRCARRCAPRRRRCWSRARASCGWSASSRR